MILTQVWKVADGRVLPLSAATKGMKDNHPYNRLFLLVHLSFASAQLLWELRS